jgi:aspartyl-tRNA synthetase
MVIIKASSTTGEWLMYDNKRSPFNETRLTLSADNSDAEEEVGQRKINMVSNGFEIGSNSAYTNSSGQTYIYMQLS